MLYHGRIDVSEGININKKVHRKSATIVLFCFAFQ